MLSRKKLQESAHSQNYDFCKSISSMEMIFLRWHRLLNTLASDSGFCRNVLPVGYYRVNADIQ